MALYQIQSGIKAFLLTLEVYSQFVPLAISTCTSISGFSNKKLAISSFMVKPLSIICMQIFTLCCGSNILKRIEDLPGLLFIFCSTKLTKSGVTAAGCIFISTCFVSACLAVSSRLMLLTLNSYWSLLYRDL